MRTTPITVTILHLWRISLISAYVTIQFVFSEKYGSLGIQNHLTTKLPTCMTMEIAIRMNPMMFVVVIVYLSSGVRLYFKMSFFALASFTPCRSMSIFVRS